MSQPRHSHTVVDLNGRLVAIGGASLGNEMECLRSVEMLYESASRSWSAIQEMSVLRCEPEAIAYEGYKIVVGGRTSAIPGVVLGISTCNTQLVQRGSVAQSGGLQPGFQLVVGSTPTTGTTPNF